MGLLSKIVEFFRVEDFKADERFTVQYRNWMPGLNINMTVLHDDVNNVTFYITEGSAIQVKVNMATESNEEFIEQMNERRKKTIKEWHVPDKFARFTCLGNYNHSFKSDKPALSLVCPVCGALMEMDNPEDFE